MAEMQTSESGGKKKHSKVRSKKASTRIDLTPMVDLGFLLITFFMLATTFNKPNVMELVTPDKKDKPMEKEPEIKEDKVLTLLLGTNDRIYYFRGQSEAKLDSTDYSAEGVRAKILEHRNYVAATFPNDKSLKPGDDPRNLAVVLIKPTEKSKYKNLVDCLDEMHITGVTRYMFLNASKAEEKWIDQPNAKLTDLINQFSPAAPQ